MHQFPYYFFQKVLKRKKRKKKSKREININTVRGVNVIILTKGSWPESCRTVHIIPTAGDNSSIHTFTNQHDIPFLLLNLNIFHINTFFHIYYISFHAAFRCCRYGIHHLSVVSTSISSHHSISRHTICLQQLCVLVSDPRRKSILVGCELIIIAGNYFTKKIGHQGHYMIETRGYKTLYNWTF